MTKTVDPETIVYFDNQFVPLYDARVSILTHALHYGTGVFEGIRGYWDPEQLELSLFRLEDHFRRWKSNCGILRITVPPSVAELVDVTVALVRRNGFECNIYVRPLAYKAAQRIGVNPDDNDAFAVMAVPYGGYLDSLHGLHAGVVSWRRIQDAAIPSRGKICGAYVNSALAGDEARRNGYDEAILLNESGHVAEGASCNIFLVRNGRLVTPPVSENILEGLTRDCVLELARQELHLDVVERPVDRSELYVADEIFFTGTAVELAPVVRVDHRNVGSAEIGPVTSALRRAYAGATRGSLSAYRKWLLPVYQRLAQKAA